MPARPTFTIDLKEGFPKLPRAPIVEAVIHWRARSEKKLKRDELRQQLVEKLPDYPTVKIQHELHVESALGPDGAEVSRRDEWHGFRLETKDGRYIAQFTRNGFVFSRVAPYEDWDRFAAEARRLWQIHVDLTEPAEIERLGVRFINRIVQDDIATLGEGLTLPPRAPTRMALPIGEFLHRTLFDVPGHPYRVHVIQTSQPPAPPETERLSLILDIDVFTTQATQLDDNVLETRLKEMRWLKNKAFYSLLTEETIRLFEEVRP
jgi:uncharacterized protein (TIGR04255 family)